LESIGAGGVAVTVYVWQPDDRQKLRRELGVRNLAQEGCAL
jgi:hypothetical protein